MKFSASSELAAPLDGDAKASNGTHTAYSEMLAGEGPALRGLSSFLAPVLLFGGFERLAGVASMKQVLASCSSLESVYCAPGTDFSGVAEDALMMGG